MKSSCIFVSGLKTFSPCFMIRKISASTSVPRSTRSRCLAASGTRSLIPGGTMVVTKVWKICSFRSPVSCSFSVSGVALSCMAWWRASW